MIASHFKMLTAWQRISRARAEFAVNHRAFVKKPAVTPKESERAFLPSLDIFT